MNLLVGIVVYNRVNTMKCWFKAWDKVIKPCPTKLAVFLNYDEKPHQELCDLILKHQPDYYIPRPNVGCDIGAFQDVINGLYASDYDWNVLGWFVDDFLPMKKDFLVPFVERMQPVNVGLVGACYEPANESNKNGHFRTVGFMGKKEVLKQLQFPATPMQNRYDAFLMEHGDNNMTVQVERLGYEAIPAIGNKFPEPGYSHWPNNSDWMWDCSLLESKNLWNEFEKEFGNERGN